MAFAKDFKQRQLNMEHLKWIIENAELIVDDVENIHQENGYMFAYLKSEIMIDDEILCVRITIKKKIATNWFWIHHIDEHKKFQITRPIQRMELKEIRNF